MSANIRRIVVLKKCDSMINIRKRNDGKFIISIPKLNPDFNQDYYYTIDDIDIDGFVKVWKKSYKQLKECLQEYGPAYLPGEFGSVHKFNPDDIPDVRLPLEDYVDEYRFAYENYAYFLAR